MNTAYGRNVAKMCAWPKVTEGKRDEQQILDLTYSNSVVRNTC